MYNFSTPILNFHQLNGSCSKITCFRRPDLRLVNELNEVYGLNCIISCLDKRSDFERKTLTNITSFSGIKLYEVSFQQSASDLADSIKEVYDDIMMETLCVLIHCISGANKTGFLVYCLLRMNGESKESATEIIVKMRGESKNGVGDYRIEYAERHLIPLLISV